GIDVADDLATAVRGADVVVAAVPPGALPAALREASRAAPSAVLTDTLSSKRDLERIAEALPTRARVVGSHPLAGSTGRGIAAAPTALAEELLLGADRERLALVLRAIAATLTDWADEVARGDDAPLRAELDAARDLRAQLDRVREDSSAK